MPSQQCPIAKSDRYGVFYIPTRYEDVAEIAYNPETFSSSQITIRNPAMLERMGNDPDKIPMNQYGAPPITSDPPFHTAFRRILLPAFSPPKVNAWEPSTRDIANARIDTFINNYTTEPYVSMASGNLCVTISGILRGAGNKRTVLCVDFPVGE